MAEPGIREGLKLLRNRDFARLFIAYLVSYFGTAMAPIAIAFGVLALTGSTRDAAIVIAASAIGQIMILLVGGTLADRTSRHMMLVGADVLAMFSQIAMAALFISGAATVPLLTALMLITGVAYALHQPAIMGFIPQVVDRQDLQAANALLGTARFGSITLGAVAAGILVATVGAGAAIAIDGLSFGVSAILIWSLTPRRQAPTDAATFFEDLRLGWKEFISHKWLWTIVLQFSLIVASIEAIFGLLGPAVALKQLGGPVDWGFIVAGFGLGTLIGGLLALKIRVRRPMFVGSILVFLLAINPLFLAVPFPVWVIAAGAVVAGIAGQFFSVLWYTTLQTHVPAHLLSRVSAYDHLGSIGIAPLGIVIAGFLFEAIGPRSTLLICAGCIMIPTLLVLCVREVRELTATVN